MERHLDLHMALPAPLARSVDRVAKARGVKRSHLVRLAIETYLKEAAREDRDASMREYVEQMAPHSGEFVKETRELVRRKLLEETEW